MTGIEGIKVGDFVRITDASTFEGEVTEIGKNDMLAIDGEWVDVEEYTSNKITVEFITPPRERGWWEVYYDGVARTFRWNGERWVRDGNLDNLLHQNGVVPRLYIGKGSQDA